MTTGDNGNADKRVAVTEGTRERLKSMKEGGETYDELLNRLADFKEPEERDVSAASVESLSESLSGIDTVGSFEADYASGRLVVFAEDPTA